jgi:ATPase subunit of ABC transporter with duplicated ATPase domains
MTTSVLVLNNLSFHIVNSSVSFKALNLSFDKQKYGIVGANGVGKTTLLKLMLGELVPDEGSVACCGRVSFLPQISDDLDKSLSVGDVLGVTDIVRAMKKIQAGDAREILFETVNERWDIENQIKTALTDAQLWPLALETRFSTLSGGEKTKVLLAKMQLENADFLLLDEPTNNLDHDARQALYDSIEHAHQGMIIVSHDRAVLNRMDRIVEITSLGVKIYGGNYDFYQMEKAKALKAISDDIINKTQACQKAKKLIQSRLERHNQAKSKGVKAKKAQIKGTGSYDKISFNSKKGQSENTNKRIRLQAERKEHDVNKQLEIAKSKYCAEEKVDVSLCTNTLPQHKMIVSVESLSFRYHQNEAWLFQNLNFKLNGCERVAITGKNGSGKSTLIKLIRHMLTPCQGHIELGVKQIAYLDQTVSMLKPDLSLVDNFRHLNPKAKPFDAYRALSAFKFRNVDAEKKASTLSGGERMRAGLAVSLMSLNPPELIILDEPTNHLDLQAIEAIETALNGYTGALLAVSHDTHFLKQINITSSIAL